MDDRIELWEAALAVLGAAVLAFKLGLMFGRSGRDGAGEGDDAGEGPGPPRAPSDVSGWGTGRG